jgi:ribosomal protein S6E (S10)
VYVVSYPEEGEGATLQAFDTRTEKISPIGSAEVGSQSYITSLDIDSTGRFLYYIPGAHGGADKDGTPVVQYDLHQNKKKVLAFLHPFYKDQYGCALVGTYSYALNADGSDLYVTWNANRSGGRAWDTCALTVIHIPPGEREP